MRRSGGDVAGGRIGRARRGAWAFAAPAHGAARRGSLDWRFWLTCVSTAGAARCQTWAPRRGGREGAAPIGKSQIGRGPGFAPKGGEPLRQHRGDHDDEREARHIGPPDALQQSVGDLARLSGKPVQYPTRPAGDG